MDYLCAQFGNFTFSRFGFIVRFSFSRFDFIVGTGKGPIPPYAKPKNVD